MPAILLVMTVLTGVVDAVSILALGRVFIANMTGNIVFIGFALARAPGFSLSASVFALAGFLLGAGLGGVLISRIALRAALLCTGLAIEWALLAGVCGLSIALSAPLRSAGRIEVAATAAIALGVQNAIVRRLAVADLTTTVLTMTLTGIAADIRSGNKGPAVLRRLLAVACMLIGAVGGALLVLHSGAAGTSHALELAVGLASIALIACLAAMRHRADWQ
jgi:uncharacterized membrane protein YoaK (UPF0700 family)